MKNIYKFSVYLVLAALLLIIGMVFSIGSFNQLQISSDAHSANARVIDKANNLLSVLKDAETGQRGFLLTGDEAFLNPYLDAKNKIPNYLGELQGLTIISGAKKTTRCY